MVWLGPLSDEPGLYEVLRPEDREWLERMCDVLPPHWPVEGTQRGLIYGVDPSILIGETIR